MIGGQIEEVAVRDILGDYESPFFSMVLTQHSFRYLAVGHDSLQ